MKQVPVAVISGASKGIGRAIAEELGSTHHIVAGGRKEADVQAVVAALPSAEPWLADVRDSTSLQETLSHLDRVDVLINAAGVWDGGPLDSFTRERWMDAFDVNVFSVAELTRVLLPALRKAHGTVVMINSGAGQFSYPGGAIYSGTKFALTTLTNVLREEERAHGVRVTSVHPGRVDSALLHSIIQKEDSVYDPGRYRPRQPSPLPYA